ncbi:MAG: 16S rRNA (cytidine(1402)-2'-O)-methyltransferase [Bacteroidetes bacterium]|nr:16S rRNA (cytidine(1402)-2'-O)-methyltransferase [Bacteroidota bacterium]
MSGILYLVATPIGNYDDMTLRAVRILKEVDRVICEERREGIRLLRHFGIEKEIEELNEHNEREITPVLINSLKNGVTLALISDAGTPVFADPGFELVRLASNEGIRVVPIPGASSLLPALVASGFVIDRFVYQGFLSPKREERIRELQELKKERRAVVVMDTPYRLVQLLRDIAEVYGEERRVCVAFDLTMTSEKFYYGTATQIYKKLSTLNHKGEFVVVIEGVR